MSDESLPIISSGKSSSASDSCSVKNKQWHFQEASLALPASTSQPNIVRKENAT